jgi:DNA-directed RNA polymerase I subunit RPA1
MVTDDGNTRRREILATANLRTLDSSANFAELNFDGDKDGKGKDGKLDAKELDRRRRLVHSALAHKLHEEKGRKLNDSRVMQALAPVTSGVIDAILPKCQMVAFPENNFEMMTGTGAKGSKVNMSQICCLLGQQQLEGQRVPVMASGKTLPCFTALETDARAGGYIADRFLTGIRPQEYFFHCMCGREGLVDTAVKTSRSGYLQRCLVKHLESLTVAYDRTVRDNDGGIHQFLYGEDGIDPVKQLGLKWLSHLADNSAATLKTIHESTLDKMDRKAVKEHQKQVRKIAKSKGISYQQARRDLPPLTSIGYADSHLGFVSEKFEDFVDGYIAKHKDLPTSPALLRGGGDAAFKQLAFFKYAKAMAQPGEPVGATAAQSIGEPSTQMTLNTFHSAGQGNATAGIPRLRELIMTASKKPANPTMTLPLDRSKIQSVAHSKELAETIAQQLSRVCISDFVNSIEVADTIVSVSSDVGYMREYKILVFLEPEHMLTANLRKCTAARTALPAILETNFTLQVLAAVEKEAAKDSKGKGLDIVAGAGERAGKGEEEEEEGRGKGKGAEESEESSDEEDASEDEGDAKKEHKKSVKGFSEADKADRKAVKKGTKAAATAKDELQDDDQDNDAMDEDEESGAGDSITLVKATPRELDKLHALTDRYRAKTSYETDGLGGKGVFEMILRVPATRRRIMMVALIEGLAAKCVVQELPGILQTHVVEPSKKEGMDKNFSIVTEGANLDLFTLWQVNRQKNIKGALDLTRVTCNDISQIRRTLGSDSLAFRSLCLSFLATFLSALLLRLPPQLLCLLSRRI